MSGFPVVSALEQYLSLNGTRASVVAANMANIDTPNYHTQDFDFQQALHQALSTDGSGATAHVALRKVPNLVERPDGNNVDLDRESMLLSEVQLQYQLGTQLMKSRFHQLLSAINGGGQ
jgi:flagellar basal-body rod protein FlgB